MVHQHGPLVKRLRHRPLTPVTPVRFWYGSPNFKSVFIAVRSHPFPFRTRQLSSLASMILGWRRPGKVDQCRHRYSSLAQSVEHSAVNRVVARSSRAGGAKRASAIAGVFFIVHSYLCVLIHNEISFFHNFTFSDKKYVIILIQTK